MGFDATELAPLRLHSDEWKLEKGSKAEGRGGDMTVGSVKR